MTIFNKTLEDLRAWVGAHNSLDGSEDSIVDFWSEWRVSKEGEMTEHCELGIVCHGHYAFERESSSLGKLLSMAYDYYSDLVKSSFLDEGCPLCLKRN